MPLPSIVPYGAETDFPVENIPFGAMVRPGADTSVCATRVGDTCVDLSVLVGGGLLDCAQLGKGNRNLNAFMSLGKAEWSRVRTRLQSLLSGEDASLSGDESLRKDAFVPVSEVRMVLPADIGDYTDCYASRNHAVNVGTMFRGKDNALMPNWTHLPVAYHGRASSVVISGTNARRPCGQVKKTPDADVAYMADPRVDFELEVACFVGTGNDLGTPMSVNEAKDNLFGLVLMNDCSARGIQAYEYVPLGPFTGKNWCTVISPWIVTMLALEEFRTAAAELDNPIEPYLQDDRSKSVFDLNLSVKLRGDDIPDDHTICKSNLKYLYWSFEQQVAHHTVSGCNMRTGDLVGSGTISGPTKDSYGSILELSWKGTEPITFPSGATRKFLADGDTVTLEGYGQGDGYRVGFGKCETTLLPAAPQTF